MANKRLIDMTDIFTEEGREKIKKGQVLVFDYEGSPAHYKIMRKNKDGVWGKRIQLVDQEDIRDLAVVDKDGNKEYL